MVNPLQIKNGMNSLFNSMELYFRYGTPKQSIKQLMWAVKR